MYAEGLFPLPLAELVVTYINGFGLGGSVCVCVCVGELSVPKASLKIQSVLKNTYTNKTLTLSICVSPYCYSFDSMKILWRPVEVHVVSLYCTSFNSRAKLSLTVFQALSMFRPVY